MNRNRRQGTWPIGSLANVRRIRSGALILLVLAGFGLTETAPTFAENHLFDQYEIHTGIAAPQTVVSGFFLGGDTAEIAVVHIDGRGHRLLQLYRFEGSGWERMLEARLGSDVAFIDVANIGGRDRLIGHAAGRLVWFDPESGSQTVLVTAPTSFDPPRSNEVPHVDITHDVNGDGLDDLVVPDANGFRVFVQMPRGLFAGAIMVGAATDLSRIYGADGYRYDPWSQSRIHQIDYDQNGRNDLVFWRGDHFEVHTQDNHGLFNATARSFKSEVAIDTDDLSFLASGDMQGRVLHSLTDMNGDGIGDLVIASLEGKRIANKRSTYQVHYGVTSPDHGVAFAPQADLVFESNDRIHLAMDRRDFDGDGNLDLMLTTIDIQFLTGNPWKQLKGLFGDDVWLELEFYRNERGRFADQPDAIHRIQLDGAPSPREPGWVPLDIVLRGPTHEKRLTQEVWPRAFNTALLIGDVTGDGRADLLIEETFRGLRLFAGVPGRNLFASEHQNIPVILPGDSDYTWLVDLNHDGRQDILLHPFTDRDEHGGRIHPPGAEPHRVTTLIAR